MGETVLRGALVDGQVRDVSLDGGVITAVTDPATAPPGDSDVDLGGYVLVPSAVEPHTHLDKAFLAEVASNPAGDLDGAIESMHGHHLGATADETTTRAVRAGRLMARNGYTAMRTHVDVTVGGGLEPLRGVLAARTLLADIIDVEVVALCGSPITGAAGAEQRALLADALQLGADLVGGCPHREQDGTRPATEYLLSVATDHGVAVDLHTDETLDPTVVGICDLIDGVDAGFAHGVTASHCVSLGMLPESEQRRIAADIARTGIGVVTNPYTNLYLQGRSHPTATPRGITATAALREARAVVAAGQDNLQDPFNPLGRGDPLEVAALMTLVAHEDIAAAYDSVSRSARAVLGRAEVQVAPGFPADLLAIRATSLREAIAMAPRGDSDRIVVRSGAMLVPSSLPAAL